MKKCLIITGGEYSPILSISGYSFIIACDKGYEYAKHQSIVPDLILGDFDSYEGFFPSNAPVMRLNREKDDTDTMAAIKYAIENGFDEIVLTCSLGKRFDHAFANVQSGIYALKHGVRFSITESDTEMYFIEKGSSVFPKRNGWSFSVFALTDKCESVSISGTKYKLNEYSLSSTFPLGVSNEWASDEATVSVGDGILMVVMCKK